MQEQMFQDYKNAIPPLYAALDKLVTQTSKLKETINTLSILAGEHPPFNDVEMQGIGSATNIAPDQFFGKPLASAVKAFLKAKGRASTAEEILDALTRGGFEFPEDWDSKFYLRSLAMSLSKNSKEFVYINNTNLKAFGLREFYPERKKDKEKIVKDKAIKLDSNENLFNEIDQESESDINENDAEETTNDPENDSVES